MHVWVGSIFAHYKCSCGEHSCPSLRGPKFSLVWDKCLGGEWPGHMEGICSTFEKTTQCFPECLNHFTLPSAEEEGPRGGWGLEPRLSPLQSLCPSLPGPRPPGLSVSAGLAPWGLLGCRSGTNPQQGAGLPSRPPLQGSGFPFQQRAAFPSPPPSAFPSPPGGQSWAHSGCQADVAGPRKQWAGPPWVLVSGCVREPGASQAPDKGSWVVGGTLKVSMGSLPSW